jgi:hypothetical protein
MPGAARCWALLAWTLRSADGPLITPGLEAACMPGTSPLLGPALSWALRPADDPSACGARPGPTGPVLARPARSPVCAGWRCLATAWRLHSGAYSVEGDCAAVCLMRLPIEPGRGGGGGGRGLHCMHAWPWVPCLQECLTALYPAVHQRFEGRDPSPPLPSCSTGRPAPPPPAGHAGPQLPAGFLRRAPRAWPATATRAPTAGGARGAAAGRRATCSALCMLCLV